MNLRELSKPEKSLVISLLISFVLFFLAFGLIITDKAGNILIPYGALFAAIALSCFTLVFGLVNSRKTLSYQIIEEPNELIPQSPLEQPVDNSQPVEEEYPEVEKTDPKEVVDEPVEMENDAVEQETVKGTNGRLTCPKCMKEFSQPIFMVSYDEFKQTRLVAHCPYCDQALDIKQEHSEEEELLKKYF